MPDRSTGELPPIAQLVADAMREHELSLRRFAHRAVDPESGYRLSHHLAKRIRAGSSFRLTPEVVRALAAGTGQPLLVVQLAAAKQFAELDIDTA